MKTSRILFLGASVSTVLLAASIATGFASTAALIVSTAAWSLLVFNSAYAGRVEHGASHRRTGVIAVASCCPKSRLRLAA